MDAKQTLDKYFSDTLYKRTRRDLSNWDENSRMIANELTNSIWSYLKDDPVDFFKNYTIDISKDMSSDGLRDVIIIGSTKSGVTNGNGLEFDTDLINDIFKFEEIKIMYKEMLSIDSLQKIVLNNDARNMFLEAIKKIGKEYDGIVFNNEDDIINDKLNCIVYDSKVGENNNEFGIVATMYNGNVYVTKYTQTCFGVSEDDPDYEWGFDTTFSPSIKLPLDTYKQIIEEMSKDLPLEKKNFGLE